MTSRPLLTPRDVRRLLTEHHLAPRKALGQNFVVDANTVRKVVRHAGVTEGDLVVEVGPGLGSLTLALRAAGARVVAVEIDAGLVVALTHVVGDDSQVEIVHADALRVDFAALTAGAPAVLVANLPYNVATPLVLRALAALAFERLLVMVQKEVGQRWVARVGHPLYGAVSVKVTAFADAEIAATISRAAFYPVPNVDSLTVRLTPKPWPYQIEREKVFALVEGGFAQRRKRLRNALASSGRRPGDVEAGLERAGLDPGARAEELDLPSWVALAAALT